MMLYTDIIQVNVLDLRVWFSLSLIVASVSTMSWLILKKRFKSFKFIFHRSIKNTGENLNLQKVELDSKIYDVRNNLSNLISSIENSGKTEQYSEIRENAIQLRSILDKEIPGLVKRKAFLNQVIYNQSDTDVPNASDQLLVEKFTRLIQDHMSDENLNNDVIAGMLGLSRSLYYGKIKRMMGITPNEYLRNVRMCEAARLLSGNWFTISEVMVKVGFKDVKYFRDCFKRIYGVNPSEYAKQYQHKHKNMILNN